MPLTLDMYRRAHAAQPGHLPADVVECLSTDFENYVRGVHPTMDHAIAAVVPSGGVSWRVKLSLERRNAAYCGLGIALWPDDNLSKRADAVCHELKRASQAPRLKPFLDVIYREGALCGIPDTFETIRKIFSNQDVEIKEEPLVFIKAAQIPK